MRIFRVETETGRGPYAGGGGSWQSQETPSRHPSPNRDSALGWKRMFTEDRIRYNFGFVSIDQFKFWFFEPEWREELHQRGFHLVEYEATVYRASDAQAIFRRDLATVVKVHDIREV